MSRRTERRWRELPPVGDAIGSPAPTDSPFSLEMMHRRRGGDRILHPCTFVVIFTPRPGKYASDRRSKHDVRCESPSQSIVATMADGEQRLRTAGSRELGRRAGGLATTKDDDEASLVHSMLFCRFFVSPVCCCRNPAQPKKPTPKKASVVGCTDTLLLRLSSSHRDILLLVSRPTTRPRPLA